MPSNKKLSISAVGREQISFGAGDSEGHKHEIVLRDLEEILTANFQDLLEASTVYDGTGDFPEDLLEHIVLAGGFLRSFWGESVAYNDIDLFLLSKEEAYVEAFKELAAFVAEDVGCKAKRTGYGNIVIKDVPLGDSKLAVQFVLSNLCSSVYELFDGFDLYNSMLAYNFGRAEFLFEAQAVADVRFKRIRVHNISNAADTYRRIRKLEDSYGFRLDNAALLEFFREIVSNPETLNTKIKYK